MIRHSVIGKDYTSECPLDDAALGASVNGPKAQTTGTHEDCARVMCRTRTWLDAVALRPAGPGSTLRTERLLPYDVDPDLVGLPGLRRALAGDRPARPLVTVPQRPQPVEPSKPSNYLRPFTGSRATTPGRLLLAPGRGRDRAVGAARSQGRWPARLVERYTPDNHRQTGARPCPTGIGLPTRERPSRGSDRGRSRPTAPLPPEGALRGCRPLRRKTVAW